MFRSSGRGIESLGVLKIALAGMLWLAGTWSPARGAGVSSLSREELVAIKFDQKLNTQVTGTLPFCDEGGQSVHLGDYLGRKPVILVLAYYQCPMLCGLVLNGLVESLLELKSDVGDQFDVVIVSIDPNEKPELAAAKKRTYVQRYGRPDAASGWHFLTGDQPAIQQLADEVGFRYAYDDGIKQYAHPSGIIVLTPQGKVARYFFGISYPPKEVGAAVQAAGANQVGSPIEQFILLCLHYNPLTGKYGSLIMNLLRVGGAATLLALAGGLVIATRRRQRRTASAGESTGGAKPELAESRREVAFGD